MIKYALYNKVTQKYLGFHTISNENGKFCVSTEFVLDDNSDNDSVWLVDNIDSAEWVKNHSTEWYNADYNSPHHSYPSDFLEVRKVVFE